jgi:uncharacterized linocin/CFP29 family protein
MAYEASQIPWTDDQWARIEDVIQQEATSARVAASFLPLFGPLPPDADFVRAERIVEEKGKKKSVRTRIDDRRTVQLATLQVKVELRGPQIADPDLSSALQLFRRAANVVARLEDLVVFRGLDGNGQLSGGVARPPGDWQITGGQKTRGLWVRKKAQKVNLSGGSQRLGSKLVTGVSDAILKLERQGHFGPFAVVLGDKFYNAVQRPDDSLVLPQDRIIPFLEGGSLLRSSALEDKTGVVVALGGAPVDLVVATDMSLNFLTETEDPKFVFRVFEKIVLRVKQPAAICKLVP